MKKSIFAVAFFLSLFASPTCLKADVIGDIDGDGKTGLADVILALQVVSKTGAAGINIGADVDGDKRIGLAEAIYTMQLLAEARILPLTFPLESGGAILIPQEAIPAEAQVSIQQVILPVMPEDLEAVGSAYFVKVDSGLLYPATTKLPIPEGEDTEKLVIIRLEDNGEITMLETQVEGEFLVARTPEFSALSAARWERKFASIRPVINGPDFLPGNADSNFKAQYYEARYARSSKLDRKWTHYEYDDAIGKIELETDENVATISVKDKKTVESGRVELQVELTEPVSGHKVIASKFISIQTPDEKNPIGLPLSLKIDAPAVVEKEKHFSIEFGILNPESTDDVISWNWSLPGAVPADKANGSCTAPCDPEIVLEGLQIPITGGPFTFNVSASTWVEGPGGGKIPDRHGEASASIFVDDGLALDYLTSPDVEWDSPFPPIVSGTAEASIIGGRGPFTYLWQNWPDMQKPHENQHGAREDTYDLFYTEPGVYVTTLGVTDLHGNEAWGREKIGITPIEKMEMDIDRPEEGKVNKEITITVKIKGGALVWYGERYGYKIYIDWGDKPDLPAEERVEKKSLNASTSLKWSDDMPLRHTYEETRGYNIRILGMPAWLESGLDKILFGGHSFVEKKTSITIVIDDTFNFPTIAVCPETIVGLSNPEGWCGAEQHIYKPYNRDSLYDYGPIIGLHEASCYYKLSGADEKCDIHKARTLYLDYENNFPNNNGCNKGDKTFQFPGSETVYSTSRVLSAWAPSGVQNPVPKLKDLVINATNAGVGAPCPPP